MDGTWLWIPLTITAAALQTGRNPAQRSLVDTLGMLGATQVRFLFVLPFALLFLAIVLVYLHLPLPSVSAAFLGFILAGAVAQIAATALMLAAMASRAFVTVTAWIKTEPIQVAVFGAALLGDPLSWSGALAIFLACGGVVLMSRVSMSGMAGDGSAKPVLLGLLSGSMFAVSVILFRGAILTLDSGAFVLNATWALVCSLVCQVLLLMVWMLLFDRTLLRACLRAWRPSIPGGLLGTAALQCWFWAFALSSAANVRTLGLIEVLFAQWVSRRLFLQALSRREQLGIVGVAVLVSQAT